MNGDEPVRPALRIVRGDPSAEDLAVLTALMTASGSGEQVPSSRVRRGGWNDPARMHRRPMSPGPNGWWAALR